MFMLIFDSKTRWRAARDIQHFQFERHKANRARHTLANKNRCTTNLQKNNHLWQPHIHNKLNRTDLFCLPWAFKFSCSRMRVWTCGQCDCVALCVLGSICLQASTHDWMFIRLLWRRHLVKNAETSRPSSATADPVSAGTTYTKSC